MSAYRTLTWTLALCYPFLAIYVWLNPALEAVKQVWLAGLCLLLLALTPPVLSRFRYLQRHIWLFLPLPFLVMFWHDFSVFAGLATATEIWAEVPEMLLKFLLLFLVVVAISPAALRLDTPDYLLYPLQWQRVSASFQWALGLTVSCAALLYFGVPSQNAASSQQIFFSVMLLNQLVALSLLEVLRLRSPIAQPASI